MAAIYSRGRPSSGHQTRPEILSFEKDLGYELASLEKLWSKREDHTLRQRLSNGLFQLWNKYQKKLAPAFLAGKILSTGDTLYQAKEYQLASVHCYGRYLADLRENRSAGEDIGDWIVDHCQKSHIAAAILALRAAVGDTASRYYHYLSEHEDPHFTQLQTRSQALCTLRDLQSCSQASLQREALYWLTYNCILLSYSICRRLMSAGLTVMAVESLLWAGVCMESCVPLLAVKFLRLRADIYTSVCQCYFHLREPYQAELFARRGLDRVHELAVLEHQSSSQATDTSERVFHEATMKLCVMVFHRSVFESRLTRKAVFRPKKRPSIRELLQQSFPRSPTEKLLTELFTGEAARFMAVLEALAEPRLGSLEKGLPHPITSLDADTTADVIQELLCAGTDLALQSLQRWEGEGEGKVTHTTLLEAATDESNLIPLASILCYVRMAISYNQREVVELLLERSTALTVKASSEPAVHRQCVSKQLLLTVEALRGVGGRRVTLTTESSHALPQEPGEKLVCFSELLHSACKDSALLELERDLLQDSVLFLWDTIRPAFSILHSHHLHTTQPLTKSRRGKEYAGILEQLVDMTECLQLWGQHPFLCGELILKLSCLKESFASASSNTHPAGGGEAVVKYDRAPLLQAQAHLQKAVQWVCLVRGDEREMTVEGVEQEVEGLALLHCELCYALTRVRVKLAATVPPPVTPEPTLKPSSLQKKVRERQEKAEQHQLFLASLSAQNTPVQSLAQLRDECDSSQYHTALLAMLNAALTPGLRQNKRLALAQEAMSLLQQLDQEQNTSPPSPTDPSLTPSPPPPSLLHRTHTTMSFKPAPWKPSPGQQVAYYSLYGRRSEGSNVKVRLSDKVYPGLGIEVPAGPGCVLKVKGLQANAEYVFAVAAYSKEGEVLGQQTGQLLGRSSLQMGQPSGGTIGETGRPIVACDPLPVLVAWGYLCQCAYMAGVTEVALIAADVLWAHFIETSADSHDKIPEYRMRPGVLDSTHVTLLYHFIYSVFIYTHLSSPPLHSSHPHKTLPSLPRPTQLCRLDLCNRLRQVLVVGGHIEESSLCLQAVVMCYGLLAPLLQRDIATPAIAEILLHCQCVLSEMPDHLLSHSHLSTQSALHHMIATSAFHLSKMLLKWKMTTLFSSLSDNARGLLFLTMPASPLATLFLRNPEIALDQSAGSQALSLTSYATASSGPFPGLLVPHGAAGQKRKKGKKKTAHLTDQISEEAKSSEFKAFDAFMAANCNSLAVPPQLDSSDITGQEDPLLLHAVIATMPVIQAHKEVHKFRRRPQYLEYFVHLATAGMKQGQHHLVLEWAQEAFTWLERRNEIILTARPVHVGTKPHSTSRHARHTHTSHPASRSLTTTNTTTRAVSNNRSTKTPSALGDSLNSRGGKPHPPADKTTPTQCKALVRHSGGGGELAVVPAHGKLSSRGRRSRKGRSSLLNETLSRLLALEGVVVTREDLIIKATSVLQTLLPEMWRNHKCRKRLRELCSDEQVWRSRANLQLAQCHLDQLLAHTQRREGGEERRAVSCVPLEGGGVICEGGIPTYPPVIPGSNQGGQRLKKQSPKIQGGADKTLGPPSSPCSPLQQLAEMMSCLQRAVVLAQRGRLWILLQNACRGLWNAINCLVTSLPGGPGDDGSTDCEMDAVPYGGMLSSPDGCISEAAVYGLASRPLYMALEATTDLLTACTTHTQPSRPDTAVGPDFGFLRRFSLLAVNTMSAQHHWEGLVSAGLRHCEGVMVGGGEGGWGREWVHDLVPVILEAQSQLAKRVAEHSADMKRDVIAPAAHIDPGPDGHDIYGPFGQALAKVCVPLDPQTVLDNLKIEHPVQNGARNILKQCRSLLAQFLADTESSVQHSLAMDHPSSQLPLLVNSYNEAIAQLEGSGNDRLLAACAMHDLGNLYFTCHDSKLSGHWWERALCCLLHCKVDGLKPWREKEEGGGRVLRSRGIPGTMLAAVLATKIARFTYANKMDTSLQYLLSAAALFKSIPASSLPHSPSALSFLPPSPTHSSTADTSSSLPAGLDLFSDPLLCDPVTSLDALHYCAQELVERKQPVKVLPVLWLYWYTAHSECRSPTHTLLSRALQLHTLTQLHLYSEAAHLLGEVLAGCGVPQTACQYDRPAQGYTAVRFMDNLPIYDTANIKALKLLMTRDLPPSVASRCGQEAVLHLSLARANLYTALASTCTTLSLPHILTRTTKLTDSPTHHLQPSPIPTPPTTSQSDTTPLTPSPSSPALPPSPTRGSRITTHRSTDPHYIKSLLVEHAEKILLEACHSLPSLSPSSPSTELRAHILLSLSRLSLSVHHTSTATQLSLAGLRVLQSNTSTPFLSSSSSSIPSLSSSPSLSVGNRLWLECRLSLAESLVGREKAGERVGGVGGGDVMECALQCEQGVREAEKFGDIESSAAFHFTTALHALALSPPNTNTILTHTQQCLQLLNTFPSLSPPSSLLHTHCTLLLCDTGRREDHVTSHDATHIYQQLVNKLRKQLSGAEDLVCTAYHPVRPLLASSLLRLSHCSESHGDRAGMLAATLDEALALCQEGLEVLESSVLNDACLKSCLLSHRVSLLWKKPSIQRSEVTNELLVAIRSIVDAKIDYSKQFSSCFDVAWLLCEAIEEHCITSPSPPARLMKHKSSRSSSTLPGKTGSPRREGESEGRVKSVPDVTKKKSYTAWCALRTARQVLVARETFQHLTTQLHNPDLARHVPEKVLSDMPEFALLDLCRRDDSIITSLLTSSDTVPVDLLVSSAQRTGPAGLTWFQVVTHSYRILTRCFWPPELVTHSTSLPSVHTLTPSLHTEYHALARFLIKHCPLFTTSCSLPSLPLSLYPPPPTQQGTNTAPPPAPPNHLRASDGEVTVVWYTPPATSQLLEHLSKTRATQGISSTADWCSELSKPTNGSESQQVTTSVAVSSAIDNETTPTHTSDRSHDRSCDDDIILGVFGFNQRAVKPHLTSTVLPPVEVFAVRATSSDLTCVRQAWQELSVAAKDYLDGHLLGRPVSRSPSRLRKQAEKTQKIQAGLQAKLSDGVRLLCAALGRQGDENELPRLEPHILGGVSSLLPPPTLPSSFTAHGDMFQFLYQLFHSTHTV